MGRYFCKKNSPFWLDNRDVQGRNEVRWRLGKETSLAFPCSNLKSFGSRCTVLKKVIMALLWLFGLPQWFGALGIVPPCSLVTPLVKCNKNRRIFQNKQTFKAERHKLPFHEHLQFSNTIGLPHGFCTDCQQRLQAAFQVSSCSFCVTSNPAPRVFSAWTCVCFANNEIFPTFNKLLF